MDWPLSGQSSMGMLSMPSFYWLQTNTQEGRATDHRLASKWGHPALARRGWAGAHLLAGSCYPRRCIQNLPAGHSMSLEVLFRVTRERLSHGSMGALALPSLPPALGLHRVSKFPFRLKCQTSITRRTQMPESFTSH